MAKKTHVKEHDRLVPDVVKRGRGRPKFEPTEEDREAVRTCAGFGMKVDEIRFIVRAADGGISKTTLLKYFSEEMERGLSVAGLKAKQKLYNLAVGGNLGALCFYLKTQHGWRETERVEMTGANGEPLHPAGQTMLVVAPMTRDSWEKVVAKRQSDLTKGGRTD